MFSAGVRSRIQYSFVGLTWEEPCHLDGLVVLGRFIKALSINAEWLLRVMMIAKKNLQWECSLQRPLGSSLMSSRKK